MKKIKKNKYLYEILLIILLLFLCLVHGYENGYNADFYPINGDFQNFNVIRRFLAGQVPYHNFAIYLGIGHLFIGSITTFIIGLGSPTLMSSKMAFQFISIFSLVIIAFTIFKAIFSKKKLVVSLMLTLLFMLLLRINPTIFSNVITIDRAIYNSLFSSLQSGNSARFLRGLAPAVFLIFSLIGIKFFNKRKNINGYSAIFGVINGLMIFYSNDYGISTLVCVFLLFIIFTVLYKKTSIKEKLISSGIFILSMILSFVLFGELITLGHISEYISSTFGTGGAQAWYYLSDKTYYIFQIDWNFWQILQAFVALIYFIIIIKKGITKDNMIRYGVPLFFNIVGFTAANEYKMLSGGYIHEVSYSILYITLIGEMALLLVNYLEKKSYKKIVINSFKIVVPSICVILCLAIFVPARIDRRDVSNRGKYIRNVGYVDKYAKSILSTNNILKPEDKLFSTYASAVEVYREEFQPSGYDYIIHVLGDDARDDYIKSFNKGNFKYVTTINPALSDFEYWAQNENWFFYKELYKKYRPFYANNYQIYWEKHEENEEIVEASISVKKLDNQNYKIVVNAPNVVYGVASITLDYELKKDNILVFNKMVKVYNESSHSVTNSNLDKIYYLPSKAKNMEIGITIVEGKGEITLESNPIKDSHFKYLRASLEDLFTEEDKNSIIIYKIKNKDNKMILYPEINNVSNLLLEYATQIKINDEWYDITVNDQKIEIKNKDIKMNLNKKNMFYIR